MLVLSGQPVIGANLPIVPEQVEPLVGDVKLDVATVVLVLRGVVRFGTRHEDHGPKLPGTVGGTCVDGESTRHRR